MKTEQDTMAQLWASSALAGGNAAYLEDLFEQYLENPSQVPSEWQAFFKELPQNEAENGDLSHAKIKEKIRQLTRTPGMILSGGPEHSVAGHSVSIEHERKQIQVTRLINAYRLQGHLHAQIEPLGMRECDDVNATELTLEDHGMSIRDLGTLFDVETFVGPSQMPLGKLYQALNESYCGSVGVEYMHIPSPEERAWIQQRIEGTRCNPNYSKDIQLHLLERLTAAEGLEKYLGAKFPGAKRFSLEGGEALIPMLDGLIQRTGGQGIKEVVIGMAHRGRLNVLVNILGKNPSELFEEFEGKQDESLASGDVKYHQGFSSDVSTEGGTVHLALAFNPSHLEIVTPVVSGSVRARQNRRQDKDFSQVFPIAIHGDAAFAGQGVVLETLNMSCTRGYGIGGTIHIVVNNQVGFTTSNPKDARSTLYCTDVAKMLLAPIFHVNADDPEACLFVSQLAADYRMAFNKDVVIDLVCYRRHGHNEADEPNATQPVMYKKIKRHPTARKIYADQLIRDGLIEKKVELDMVNANRDMLVKGQCVARNIVQGFKIDFAIDWSPYFSDDWRENINTGLSKEKILQLAKTLTDIPEGFKINSRVGKIVEDRKKMAEEALPVDWGFAENLAYASLVDANIGVRLSGQDVGRGTFFHRHAVWHEQNTGQTHIPLSKIREHQAHFEVIDSLLSEEAVLAFEYGHATADPTKLVIWEAQFGDFANGAQVVVDQFISSGEQKWGRLCGLTMLLPHGYEGQGPEHSSARLERYLQLCAQHNIQVCIPSNAAQVFHMLRRQMIRKLRKPLIVMSPKSLLRHKAASCQMSDLIHGQFQPVISDEHVDKAHATSLVMCSGKIYYELDEARKKAGNTSHAIVRIEQLYPFPEKELKECIAQFPNVKDIIWCQEEPLNQGAWFSSQHHFRACLNSNQSLRFAGREASAAPAVGYFSFHQQQQNALIEDALK